MPTRRRFFLNIAASGAAAAAAPAASPVSRIDIVHHTHTDIGYTDLPSVVRDKQIRYLNTAIALCRAQPSFRWTVESLVGLQDWWQASPVARRNELLGLVRAGRIDVMGLPFNQTPLLDALQWKQMMEWIRPELWRQVNPRAAMQNDVNGFPRAGALRLLDKGIGHLLMGINADSGGPPFERPSAFWWKMPDGRRMFVWLGEHYGRAMEYLGYHGSDLPKQDEGFLASSHSRCLKHLERLRLAGYPHSRLLLTFTHPQGYDNGSPFPPLAPFVEKWNAARLSPALHLVTATQAVREMEADVGAAIPTLEGEWTDWWANGSASGPREIAASRFAKRHLAAALSPVWGPVPASAAASVESVLRDLCLFDEHTWGAAASIGAPHSLNTLAQYNEKSELAYRPMGHAEWLLDRRVRTKLATMPAGVYAVNPTPAEYTGWAPLPGGKQAWIGKLAAHSLRLLPAQDKEPAAEASRTAAVVETDTAGWPVRASWPGMAKPLFDGAAGGFIRGHLIPPADRRTITRLHANPNPGERGKIRQQSGGYSSASGAQAQMKETDHTLLYTQELRHDRIANARRSLELWKSVPRARLTLRFERLSSVNPEILYADFSLPRGLPLPQFSSGGLAFTPYRDQLKGSCRDYFGIDGWAHYRTTWGDWLWTTRDAPLVCVGGPHMLERHETEPDSPERILALLFDNCWHTNFAADCHGAMEFRFDLLWMPKIDRPQEWAATICSDPVVFVNPQEGEHPAVMNEIYRP